MEIGQQIKTIASDGTKIVFEIKRITKLLVFCEVKTDKNQLLESESKIYKSHFDSWVKSQQIFNW